MTKNEVVEKTLKDMGPLEPAGEEIAFAELQRRLPDSEINTCDDFKHLNTECCESCHTFEAHFEMKLLDLPDGSKAWVCHPVEWAVYPERLEEFRDALRNSPDEKMFSRMLWDDDLDDSSPAQ